MSRGGFTLMEVLVSLVIVVVAITIIAQGFSAGAQSMVISSNATLAANLAEEKMAELETGEISLTTGTTGEFEDHEGFSYEIEPAASETEGLYEVTLTITYPHMGEDQTYVLHRLMRTRPGQESEEER